MSSHSHLNGRRESQWRPLSDIERGVLTRLLSAEFPGRKELVKQAAEALARTLDAEGSVALLPTVNASAAEVVHRIPVEAIFEDLDGVSVHVLLHVVRGFLDELEIYRDDSAPVQGDVRPASFRLIVL